MRVLLLSLLASASLVCAQTPAAQTAAAAPTVAAGRNTFENRCSGCHGADGNGGELGPPIARRISTRDDAQLTLVIRDGLPNRGMPPSNLSDTQARELIAFLRTLRPARRAGLTPVRGKVQLDAG